MDFLNAFIGLAGVAVGSLIALWGQMWTRDADLRNDIRRAFGEWIEAHLKVYHAEQRWVDMLLAEKDVASKRPLDANPAKLAEWQATLNSLASAAADSHASMDLASAACEAAYARVMMIDYNGRRISKLSRIQESKSPYVLATAAAKEAVSEERIDTDAFGQSWRKLGLERGKLARYVEVTLRQEARIPWLSWLRQSSGSLPKQSVIDSWERDD